MKNIIIAEFLHETNCLSTKYADRAAFEKAMELAEDERMPCATPLGYPGRKMSVKDALFAPSENVSVNEAAGRILADTCVTCPPAVPVAICGEVLDEAAIKCFRYYGIKTVNVVDCEVK